MEPTVEIERMGRRLRLVPPPPALPDEETIPPRLMWPGALVRVCVATDAVAITVAVLIAVLVHPPTHRDTRLFVFAAAAVPLWLLAMNLSRAHESRFLALGSEEFKRVFDAALRVAAVAALAAYGLRADVPRPLIVVALPIATVLGLLGRYGVRKLVHRLRRNGRCVHRVLLVGNEREVFDLTQELRRAPYTGLCVIGCCIDGTDPRVAIEDDAGPYCDPMSVYDAAVESRATAIAVTSDHGNDREFLRRLAWSLEDTDIDLMVAPALTDFVGPRIHIRPVAGLPLLHIEKPQLSGGHRLLKTFVDRIVGITALLCFLPLLLVVALSIRLTSRGPALFRQRRIGRAGREFVLYKFRTMYVGAESKLVDLAALNEHGSDGVLFKMRRDPRVTRIGRFLRRYSIDELPQLLNVIRGDMSLVGPRPPLPSEVERYDGAIRRRMLVHPGLTGLWQVSGRAELDWQESVRLDLYYVENWSLALDALILWKTVPAVLRHRGAY